MAAQNPSIISFLIGEIPFLLFMAFLIYIWWIRPKRMEKHEEEEEKARTWYPGDRILFYDGMIGEMVKRSSSYITVTSGMKKEVFEKKAEDIYLNLSYEERKKEADKKLPLLKRIAKKI